MKILIDIGHPAHVHYFRNFIKIMESKGHKFLITARDKEVSQILLDKYNIPYINRGKGGKGLLGKAFYLLKANYIILKESIKFKPDIFLSFASPYAAQISFLISKPHIAFTDTEHAKLGNYAFMPFTSTIITPSSFDGNLGKKHIKFNGFMEQCYLDNKYFKPKNINNILNNNSKKYVILRFVSWNASHDIGHSGLDNNTKKELIKIIEELGYDVYISSEANMSKEFEKYILKISPENMHDVLANASLFVGEGATMASECAILGTPAIYVNSLDAGTLQEQEKYGCIFGFRNSEGVIEKVKELLNNSNLYDDFKIRNKKLLENTIDVTSYMVWLIENYPKSIDILKKNYNYQYNFKRL